MNSKETPEEKRNNNGKQDQTVSLKNAKALSLPGLSARGVTMAGTRGYHHRNLHAEGKCERCSCQHGLPHRSTGYKVSLATVHLNHNRTDNRFNNLAAFCQGCHMWWDHKRHMYNRKYGKETYYRNGVLFSMEEMIITVPKLKNHPVMMSLFKQDMTGSLCWKTLFDDCDLNSN